MLQRSAPETTPPLIAFDGAVHIQVPSSTIAGEAVTVLINADVLDDTDVYLIVVGSYGVLTLHDSFLNGTAHIALPSTITNYTGAVTLTAHVGTVQSMAQMMILPGPAVDPVVPLVGARSIVADGQDWSMTVAIPHDVFGNPITEHTPVDVHVYRPDGEQKSFSTHIRHLLAWQRITSRTHAGRTSIAVTTQQAHGPESHLLEVAGLPVNFRLMADPPTLPADGQQLLSLRTEPLHDRFGNPLPDGTLVTFVVEMPGGEPRRIPTYTIDSVAEAPLQAPELSGNAMVYAVAAGVVSESLTISFTDGLAVGDFVVNATVLSETVVLETGSLLGTLQQHIPDGSQVDFVIVGDANQQRLSTVSEEGKAEIVLRKATLEPGHYSVIVRVGGRRGLTGFHIMEQQHEKTSPQALLR